MNISIIVDHQQLCCTSVNSVIIDSSLENDQECHVSHRCPKVGDHHYATSIRTSPLIILWLFITMAENTRRELTMAVFGRKLPMRSSGFV